MTAESAAPAGRTKESKPLYNMFNEVPQRYDLVNTAITWGLDKRWRRQAALECLAGKPRRFLDLCCGTGDLACDVSAMGDPGVEVVGFDFSQPMLDLAAQKARGRPITFVRGDASNMPFPEGHFDTVGISFGFRNLTWKNPMVEKHLSEVLRVLRPGGRFVAVETAQPTGHPIRGLYHLYLRLFVSGVGSALGGNRGAYRYLAESAAHFYTPEEVRQLLLGAGFSAVSFRTMMLGAVGLYTATK